VDDACRKRYEESRGRLRRTAVRFFYLYSSDKSGFRPAAWDTLWYLCFKPYLLSADCRQCSRPPILMALIILTVSVPGDDIPGGFPANQKHHWHRIPTDRANWSQKSLSQAKKSGDFCTRLFSARFMRHVSCQFRSIIYLLSLLNFFRRQQAIFLFFITLVLFFTYRVIQISKEYQVVDKKGLLTPLTDFFSCLLSR